MLDNIKFVIRKDTSQFFSIQEDPKIFVFQKVPEVNYNRSKAVEAKDRSEELRLEVEDIVNTLNDQRDGAVFSVEVIPTSMQEYKVMKHFDTDGNLLGIYVSESGGGTPINIIDAGIADHRYYTKTESDLLLDTQTHNASDITSGQFNDALVAESNVTQHQLSLTIQTSQIQNLVSFVTDVSDVVDNTSHRNSSGNPHNTSLEDVRLINNSVNGSLNLNGNQIQNLLLPVNASDAATKDYVDSKINGLDWQESVIGFETQINATESTGNRYIALENGVDWVENYIYEWNGSEWLEIIPDIGSAVFVENQSYNRTYNGSSWASFGSTVNHGNLLNLTSDDHPQYHNDDRALIWLNSRTTTDLPEGDNLYYTTSRFDTAFNLKTTDDLTQGSTNLYLSTVDQNKLNLISVSTQINLDNTLLSDDNLSSVESSNTARNNLDAVGSVISGITGATEINNIIQLSQSDYDTISTPDPNTLYIIND